MRRTAAMIVAGALAVTGCSLDTAKGKGGGSGTIDPVKVEYAIESAYQHRREITVNADCPSGVKIEPTREFQCIVRYRGLRIIVRVTIQNDQGDVIWQTVDGSLSG